MQYDERIGDLEARIEAWIGNGTHGRGLHQRNDDPPLVIVQQCRLHDDDIRNGVAMLAIVPVNVELGHQSVECSSANDPRSSAKRFQVATVACTACDSAARWRFSSATNAASSVSITAERLPVILRACATRSSLSVRFTGRLGASSL